MGDGTSRARRFENEAKKKGKGRISTPSSLPSLVFPALERVLIRRLALSLSQIKPCHLSHRESTNCLGGERTEEIEEWKGWS